MKRTIATMALLMAAAGALYAGEKPPIVSYDQALQMAKAMGKPLAVVCTTDEKGSAC